MILTLGESPGDGAALLTDYTISMSDVTAAADFHTATGNYNSSNTSTVVTIDGSTAWRDAPTAVEYEDSFIHEGNGVDNNNALFSIDLY